MAILALLQEHSSFNVGVKIVVICFNDREHYVHVRFHDQFVMWYQKCSKWESKKLLVRRQQVVHTWNVGVIPVPSRLQKFP